MIKKFITKIHRRFLPAVTIKKNEIYLSGYYRKGPDL